MEIGEKLLNLAIEYKNTLEARTLSEELDGSAFGRDPSEIAAEYEEALRRFVNS